MKKIGYILTFVFISFSCLFPQGYEIWGSGANSIGELGNNNTSGINIFEKVSNTSEWKVIATKEKHTLGIKFDGTLWAWGLNTNGQLGDGTTINRINPVQIGKENDWVAISTGTAHSMAIKIDGSLWGWGANTVGQLGDNSLYGKLTPTKIGNENDWKQVSCGSFHTAAIKTDNTLWTWGRNNAYQLGDGLGFDNMIPNQITINNNWKFVSAGNEHTIALRNDGTLWSWGSNENGQLGLGSKINFKVPTQIGFDDDWTAISSGYEHAAAIKNDGSLWQWGLNGWGQLADGTLNNLDIPTKVGVTSDWKYIVSGFHNSIGIKYNGTLWISGCNTSEQIGYDTTVTKISAFRKLTRFDDWNSIAVGNHFILALRGYLPLKGNITTNKLNNEICMGDSIQLNANVTEGVPKYSYSWTPINLVSNPNISNPMAYPNKSTIFKVEIIDSEKSRANLSIYVKVNDKSNIRINYKDSICQGEVSTAIASGGQSYKWYIDSISENTLIGSTNILNTTPLTNVKYIIETYSSNCYFYDTLYVKVSEKINVEIGINGNKNICSGDYTKIYIKDKIKDVIYTWEKDGNIYFSDTLIVNNSSGKYFLIGKPLNLNLCSDTAFIEILSIPLKPMIGFEGSISLCQGDSVKLFIKDKLASVDYEWIVNGAIVNADTIIAKTPQKYKLIAKNKTFSGCNDSTVIEVTEQIKEELVIAGVKSFCEGDSTKIEISKPFPGVQFEWNTGEKTNSIIVNKAGTYWCRATNNNCLTADTIQISVNPKPIINITGDTTLCKNATGVLTLNGTYTSCTWTSGATTPSITITKAGIYTAQAENEFGCKSVAQIEVKDFSQIIDMTKFQDIDFGKTNVNISYIREIDISGLEVANYKLKLGVDYTLNRKGDKIEVVGKATKNGTLEDSLYIEIVNPCPLIIAFKLTTNAENDKNISLKVADIEVLAGDTDIPLAITYKLNDNVSLPQTITWTAKLNYKSAIYYPEIVGDVQSANRNIDIILSGTKTLTKKEDTLTIIKGKTYLADTIYTKVKFIDFTINPDFTIIKEDGSIKITGLCVPNLRGIEFFTPTTMIIKPNPTSGEVDIEFTSEENGDTKLKLFNSTGAEVLTDSKNKKDKTITFHFDKLDLPNGIYQAQIEQSGKIVQSANLVIEK